MKKSYRGKVGLFILGALSLIFSLSLISGCGGGKKGEPLEVIGGADDIVPPDSKTFGPLPSPGTGTTGPGTTTSVAVCGNGVREGFEQCDDGGLVSGDGCSISCQLEPPPPPVPVCGDGTVIAPPEQCDDGNTLSGDGCSNTCQIDLPVCGNGTVDAGEACDDGNTVNADSCTNSCALPSCGDGIVQPDEACDDGNTVNADSCRTNCVLPRCGDSVKDSNEACDDGNSDNFDGCSSTCQTAPSIPNFRLTFVSKRGGGHDNLYLGSTHLNPTTLQKITNNTGGSSFSALAFRHDGAKIAFGNILLSLFPVISVWDQNSGLATVLADIPAFAPSWSPSGDKIYFLSLDEGGKLGKLMVANADGSNVSEIRLWEGPRGRRRQRLMREGVFDKVIVPPVETGLLTNKLIISWKEEEDPTYDLYLVDLTIEDKPKARTNFEKIAGASNDAADDLDSTISSDGTLVWVRKAEGSFQIRSCKLDVADAQCENDAVQLTSTNNNTSPSICEGGSIVFTSNRDGNKEIYWMKADGSQQTRLTENNAEDRDPSCGPEVPTQSPKEILRPREILKFF